MRELVPMTPEELALEEATRRRHTRMAVVALLVLVVLPGLSWLSWQLTRTPLDAQAHYERALSFAAERAFQSALVEIKQALQLAPDHADAQWLAARLYLELGDGTRAADFIQRIPLHSQSRENVALALARANILKGEYQAALVGLATENPDNPAVRVLIGKAKLSLGRTDDAQSAFQAVLEQHPSHVEAHLGLARLALHRRDNQLAQTEIELALAADDQILESWLLKGEAAFARADFDQAQTALKQALELRNDHVRARYGLVHSLLKLRRTEEAERYLAPLVAAQPANPSINYLLALAGLQKNDLDRAKNAFADGSGYSARSCGKSLLAWCGPLSPAALCSGRRTSVARG